MKLWNFLFSIFKKREKSKGLSKKVSLHIGINDYPGSANDLQGCVNDANGWKKLLEEVYGFRTTILINNKATYRNVVREMKKIILSANEGDVVIITYSGHGTNVRDLNGDEVDKRDEAICLFDKLLIDDEIRNIFDKINKKARLTFISDSCHSGTVTRSFLNTLYDEDSPKPRYLPPEDDQEAFNIVSSSVSKKIFATEENMNEVLITGCNSTQYSYDAKFGSTYYGAMTYNSISILRGKPDCTYEEFYKLLRKRLPNRRYPQTPQLEGNLENKKRKIFT